MKLVLRRCHTCKALGVGPHRVKLWPFEGRLYCKRDYMDALTWDESRWGVVGGIKNIHDFDQAVTFVRRYGRKVRPAGVINWSPYIVECAELAGWALVVDDRRTFVYYFSRALWAWALKEEQECC